MDMEMDIVMRPRYRGMPDPIETADDSDKALPAAIRFVDFRGDLDTYFEIKVVGPYPDEASRDRDLVRLRGLPLGNPNLRGTVQFHVDRIGTVRADEVVPPGQVATATTLRQFFAAWAGCTEAEYYRWDDDPEEVPDEVHPDQVVLF